MMSVIEELNEASTKTVVAAGLNEPVAPTVTETEGERLSAWSAVSETGLLGAITLGLFTLREVNLSSRAKESTPAPFQRGAIAK